MRIVKTILFLSIFLGLPLSWAEDGIEERPLKIVTVGIQPKEIPGGSNAEITLQLELAGGFHAYQEQFLLLPQDPNSGIKFTTPTLAPVVNFHDKISKKDRQGIASGASTLKAVIEIPNGQGLGPSVAPLYLQYQACTDEYCLFPQKVAFEVNYTATESIGESSFPAISDSGLLKIDFASGNWGWIFLLVFLAGLLTSFTPCIFPMIPITLAVLGARKEGASKLSGLLISVSYVLGIAMTYSVLGLLAASTGSLFGSLLGHPVVIIGLSLLFVAMSLSMLGLFELTVPHAVSQRLANSPNSGGKRNAFVIGAIAGIVASPCVGPVLVSILAYVAKTQQLVLGFFLLFVFALGMGQIFIVLGTFSQLVRRLPRSGNWMNGTKYIFSFIMICMSIYYLSPILSPLYFNIIVAIAFQIFALIFIFKSGIPLIRALGGLILLFALVVLSGTLQKEPPRFGTVMQNLTQSIKEGPQWIPFSPEKLKEAQKSGHSVVIDFFADWCAACKELESYTFSKKSVLQAAQTKNVVWMKYDATIDNELTQIYQKMFEVRGLPTILLFDSSGLRKDLTLTGFESAEKFIERLSQLK